VFLTVIFSFLMVRITMPMAPISMRKLKEILKLKYGCLLSHRKIAKSLSVSASIMSTYAIRATSIGSTSWPLNKSVLNSFTHRTRQRVAVFLERESLLVRDDDNDYLALDGLVDDPMLQIHGYSITYRIATGKQQGRKVFTLQTIAPMAEQGLAAGCAVNVAGFSLHAGVMSNAQDRGKLERLCRWLL
jgi:GR25 family glycosyltransferase involved in LPS biosynthesis